MHFIGIMRFSILNNLLFLENGFNLNEFRASHSNYSKHYYTPKKVEVTLLFLIIKSSLFLFLIKIIPNKCNLILIFGFQTFELYLCDTIN